MTPRRPIVGGNWKMNTDLVRAVELAEDVAAGDPGLRERCEVVLYPPFPYLQAVGHALRHHGIRLGAQDVYHRGDGAFTGEVSASMLGDLGVSMVLVGHSERRHVIGEDDELVSAKLRAALDGDLDVTLCVGETLEQREAGRTETVVADQLRAGLDGVSEERARRLVVAYEPIWAIGTGRTASPADAQAVHAAVRQAIASRWSEATAAALRVQYGGSVKPSNAAELIAEPDVDGFLVGGASLAADDFLAIIEAAATARTPAPGTNAGVGTG